MTTLPTPYYDDGQVTIFHGDCRDVLPSLEAGSVQVAVTSPPYNLGNTKWDCGGDGDGDGGRGWKRAGRKAGIGYASWTDDLPFEEYVEFQRTVLNDTARVVRGGGSFFYNHKARTVDGRLIHPVTWLHDSDDWFLRQEIVWDRGSSFNHNPALFWQRDERVYWLTKGKPSLPDRPIGLETVWYIAPEQPSPPHPAPFPLILPSKIIAATTEPDDVVLDPFMGSGTTLRAAMNLGRRCIGIELEERYCEIAVKRLQQSVMQFDEPATRANRCTEVVS